MGNASPSPACAVAESLLDGVFAEVFILHLFVGFRFVFAEVLLAVTREVGLVPEAVGLLTCEGLKSSGI